MALRLLLSLHVPFSAALKLTENTITMHVGTGARPILRFNITFLLNLGELNSPVYVSLKGVDLLNKYCHLLA